MKREIITTADGSSTIFLPDLNEHYHSKHGAVQEAYHVFIKTGLEHFKKISKSTKSISILEIGFGTGLNALITLFETRRDASVIKYTGVEAYPVSSKEIKELNYSSLFSEEDSEIVFQKLHDAPWGETTKINEFLQLQKQQRFFSEITDVNQYNLIYFDAFGARVQPELWTKEIFQKMFTALRSGGLLVTYSAKGSVRRAMEAVGFLVERLPGPPGKREMLRASKK